MSYITAIGTANPPHRFSQRSIAEFMLRAMQLQNGDERKLRTVFRASGIEYRHSVLSDYGKSEGFEFFPETKKLEPFPGTGRRLDVFRREALGVSVASFEDMRAQCPDLDVSEITHLVVVCCTGMYAPGLDVDLLRALELSTTVQRTAINFMGCQAAFNALKVADSICRSDVEAKVLVVCTELCSLHFQRAASDDNLLANALFADGSASLLVEAVPEGNLRLRIEGFHSDLATDGISDMAWTIGDAGFEMRLSSYVPDLIRQGVRAFTEALLSKVGSRRDDIRHFAIHPGGKKILQVIEEQLGISADCNAAAHHVLRNFGNMSSPTVLFVLKEVIRKLDSRNAGERVLGMAFGPGLTLESVMLKIETT